jgi:acyl dehydratase
MAIEYPAVMNLTRTAETSWTERDTMLYALGLGAGEDPLDPAELRFVTEFDLQALPTMPTVLATAASPASLSGMNRNLAVHADQSIRLLRPMPTSGAFRADGRMLSVHDKGEGRGAVLITETTLTDVASREVIAILHAGSFARGDGGFGGPTDPTPAPHPIPNRAPDVTLRYQTRPDQALLYRLSGDYNPIHADPELAKKVGFERPILHGLCTYGITGRAVLKAFADQDPARLVAHQVRFSAPVLPGDALQIDLWRDGDIVSFEASVPARGVTVIKNGRSELA